MVDSGSTDRTCEIAREMGAEVLAHPFENYARQFNWGVDAANVQTEWILRLDADERFPDALNRKLETVLRRSSQTRTQTESCSNPISISSAAKSASADPKKRKIMLYRTGRWPASKIAAWTSTRSSTGASFRSKSASSTAISRI